MRISDWSSDVCSSDLAYVGRSTKSWLLMANRLLPKDGNLGSGGGLHRDSPFSHQDRMSVVQGKSVSERFDLGGRRRIKKKKVRHYNNRNMHVTSSASQ